MNEEATEEKTIPEYIHRALRGPRSSVYQQLLSQKLIKANQTKDLLLKASYICEAAHMSRNKDKLDMDLIKLVYTVVQSLLNTEIPKKGSDKSGIVTVAWNFPETEENWKTFIEPWQKLRMSYYAWESSYRRRTYPTYWRYSEYQVAAYEKNERLEQEEKIKEQAHQEIMKLPPDQIFYQQTGALGRKSFFSMKGEFEGWAVPRLMEHLMIMMDEIDPKIYSDTLTLLIGEQRESDEI